MDHLLRRVGFYPTLKTQAYKIMQGKSISDFPAIPMAAYHTLNVASNGTSHFYLSLFYEFLPNSIN